MTLQFGINSHRLWREQRTALPAARDLLDKCKAVGFGWVRVDVGWATLQLTAKDKWETAAVADLDTAMKDYTDRGLKVLMMVKTAPFWASGKGTVNAPDPAAPAKDPADFGRAVAWLAKRYGCAVQLGNEPNLVDNFAGDATAWATYQTAAIKAARAIAPDGFYVAAAPTYLGLDKGWLEACYKTPGFVGSYDALAIHPYISPSNLSPATDAPTVWTIRYSMAELRKLRAKYGDTKPIFATEFGQSTHSVASTLNHKQGVSEAQQATDLPTFFTELAKWSEITHAFAYTDRDMVAGKDEHERRFGLFRTDNSPKPVVAALTKALNDPLAAAINERDAAIKRATDLQAQVDAAQTQRAQDLTDLTNQATTIDRLRTRLKLHADTLKAQAEAMIKDAQ